MSSLSKAYNSIHYVKHFSKVHVIIRFIYPIKASFGSFAVSHDISIMTTSACYFFLYATTQTI